MNNSKTTLKKTIKINSEFASELVCVIPYTYWLHERGELEKEGEEENQVKEEEDNEQNQ